MLAEQLPAEVEVIHRVQESATVFTLSLAFTDGRQYRFEPGQFNMLYLYGVGEIPISIVSDPSQPELLVHTIRAVGRVTRAMANLRPGDRLGLRGPYGRGWPMQAAEGRDVLLVTGGLGCAPSVSIIEYVLKRRAQFGDLTIVQGVRHADDMIWCQRYEAWSELPRVEVRLAADACGASWPWHVGRVTELLHDRPLAGHDTIAMMCGPEVMMRAAAETLLERGLALSEQWVSMERNMQCAVGLCGHCQYAADFICRDGPVFRLADIWGRFGVRGA